MASWYIFYFKQTHKESQKVATTSNFLSRQCTQSLQLHTVCKLISQLGEQHRGPLLCWPTQMELLELARVERAYLDVWCKEGVHLSDNSAVILQWHRTQPSALSNYASCNLNPWPRTRHTQAAPVGSAIAPLRQFVSGQHISSRSTRFSQEQNSKAQTSTLGSQYGTVIPL